MNSEPCVESKPESNDVLHEISIRTQMHDFYEPITQKIQNDISKIQIKNYQSIQVSSSSAFLLPMS